MPSTGQVGWAAGDVEDHLVWANAQTNPLLWCPLKWAVAWIFVCFLLSPRQCTFLSQVKNPQCRTPSCKINAMALLCDIVSIVRCYTTMETMSQTHTHTRRRKTKWLEKSVTVEETWETVRWRQMIPWKEQLKENKCCLLKTVGWC